jgi:transposase
MVKRKRKNYPATKKVVIIKSHLIDKVPVSDLCDQHGEVAPVFRTGWRERRIVCRHF